jgi:rhodanese-related sulfurtransferase
VSTPLARRYGCFAGLGWLLLLLLALAVAPRTAQAMAFEQVGEDLFAAGPITAADVQTLRERLATGLVRRLVLVNSAGGELRAGLLMARQVQAARLQTLVSGHCYSACSLVFMAGAERAFATGHHPRATLVGIHGPSRRETRELAAVGVPQMLAFYQQRMGERFKPEVIGPALTALEDHTGMLRIREPGRNRPADRVPWFCPSSQMPAERCVQHPEQDALSLGVVTQPHTVPIELPTSMRVRPAWFGVELLPDEKLEDPQQLASVLIPEACREQARCREGFEAAALRWVGAEFHRAVAVTLDGRGYAFTQGAPTPRQAAHTALFSCNHPQGRTRLCRLLAVDDRRVPEALAPLPASVGLALAREAPEPDPAALLAERSTPTSPPRETLRTDAVRLPTPASLEGVEVIDTAQLLQRLRSEAPPIVIDVAAEGERMIPGALHIVNGGRAVADPQADAALEKRFQALLRAAGAFSVRQPALVFYGEGPNTWWAFNAAMRAAAAGYPKVLWYRGGMEAWQRAGMPTQQKTAAAVLS